ncbi:cytochrome c3 family protein [Desulfuromonas acetoxidans]|uniref:cytochrome c3 family protein n=1 Tax=Desulfuromonas acetoxidans TaxID=891 RepID=UPI0029304749|nr:cytochrome c3 family protein [Desulfuromonas acetoxidans]
MHDQLKHFYAIVVTSLCLLLLSSLTCQANDALCLDCHDEIKQVIDESYYVHEPVRAYKCRVCHARDEFEPSMPVSQPEPNNNYVLAYKQTTSHEEQPIIWLVENFTPAFHQSALIKQRKLKDRLILDLWYQQAGKKTHQFDTPDLDALQTQNPRYQMLAIDNLYLTDFDTRLVPRATLHWNTNEPSRCTTSYGNKALDVVYEEDDLYLYDHHIDLRNFTDGGYVVEISCRDPYRRVKTTDRFNILTLPVREQPIAAPPVEEDRIALKNLQGKLWIEVESHQPASLSVGVQKTADRQQAVEEPLSQALVETTTADSERSEDEHITLNTRLYTTTQVCHKCHTGLEPGQSHPVNVLPPLNMIVPPEYKRLKNGKISCMTCHTVHGSNTEHRLIKKSPKALCTGCHTNY